jgi:hypothetical protein
MAALAPALWFGMLIGIVAEPVVCAGGATPDDPRNPSAAARLTGGEADGGGATVIESKLAVSDTAVLDFGTAVAVSGDLLVSTAPRSTISGGVYAGAAQVYLRDPTSNQWLAQKQLVPHDSAANDEFGLTASADGETVAVGAPNAQMGSVFQQGAVYLFERNRGGADQWGEMVKLTDNSVGFEGHFGASVALSGDLLVVGATMPPHGGKAMIFERNRGGPDAWGNVATILDSDTSDGGLNEAFGSAVAIDGDLLLIGASMADVSYYNENDGAAYLFMRDPIDRDRWTFVTRLAAAEALACTGGATLADLARNSPDGLAAAQQCAREYSRSDNDAFGGAVALKGDVAAVGAHCAEGGDSSATPIYCAGAVYVFRRDPATSQWTQEAKLASSPAGAFSYFGGSVALASDLLLIGAHGASVDGKLAQGQAHAFQRDAVSGSWLDTQPLTASDGLRNDGFATSVTLDDRRSAGAARRARRRIPLPGARAGSAGAASLSTAGLRHRHSAGWDHVDQLHGIGSRGVDWHPQRARATLHSRGAVARREHLGRCCRRRLLLRGGCRRLQRLFVAYAPIRDVAAGARRGPSRWAGGRGVGAGLSAN